MNIKISIIQLISHIASICCIRTDIMDMVISFVTYEEVPTSLLMPGLCWTPYELKTLARTLCKEGSSVAYSLQPNRTEHFLQHIVVLTDMSCPGIHEFLVKASHQGYFKSPYRWLIVDEHSRDLGLLETLEMPVNSDVVIARRLGDDILFIEAYRISEKFSVIYTPRSKWRPLTTYPKKYYENTINSLLHNVDNKLTINNIDEYYQNLTNGDEEKLTKEDLVKTNENPAIKSNEGLTTIKVNEELTNAIDAAKNRKLVTTIVTINKYGVIEDFRETRVLVIRRKNLRKHVLTMANVVTDTNETRLHLSDRLQLNQDSITKMSYSVVTICFDMLNSTEHLLFTHTWGYKDKNGNWQGIIDHLLKKEADLGTLTIFTQDRMSAIDYIAMVGSTKVRFIFREPPLAYISNIFAMPFTGAVWLAILICVLGCAVFLYITSKWEAMMHSHPLQLDGSWADVLILIIGAVLQQGCTLEPRQAAGRCVTLLLFVALTILYAAYSANIVVLLRAPSSSVRTLKDLLNSPLELGASDFEYNRYFFKKLNEPLRKEIYDKKIAPKGKKPHFYSMKEGVAKIRKGLFAFHMEPNPGYRLIQETYQEDEKCDLVEIDYINEIDPWVPGQKRSPFKDLFRINFLKIRESGIQLCVFQRLQVPRPKCSGSISSFSSVGITDMYPAMLMTLYGMLMAPAVLVLEIAYKQLLTLREKRKMRKEFHNEP